MVTYTMQRTYSGMSDAVHSNSNLSLAGLAAAKVAAAVGRVQRCEKLTNDDRAQIKQVSTTLARYGEVFAGKPYMSATARYQPMDTLAEIAVKSGQHRTKKDAEERFKELSLELMKIEASQALSEKDLEEVHVYFRNLSRRISQMLTVSGERDSDDSFR